MFKIIKNIKLSFVYIYPITLFFMGTYLILNSIKIEYIGANYFENIFYDNNIEKPKEFEVSYKNYFANFDIKDSASDEPEKYFLHSLPKDLNFMESVKIQKKKPINSLPKDLHLIEDVKIKKEKFINSLLPLIIAENQKILSYRYQIIRIQNSLNFNKTLNKSDQIFIENMALKFIIKVNNRHKIDIIDDLLDRVDIIPNSIVLAQAANESGWGSSRFAREFNALFGQYTYNDNNGVKPSSRKEGEKHLIKFFPTINHSIESYFNNINTHYAYNNFRLTRKYLRVNDLSFDPDILIKTLGSYAKDKNYIDIVTSIIKVNKLTQYDDLITI